MSSAIEQSIRANNIDILTLLLSKDINLDSGSWKILQAAITNNNLQLLKIILADGRCDSLVTRNHSLRFSMKYGMIAAMELLLKDERFEYSIDNNSIVEWAADNNHIDIIKILLNDDKIKRIEVSGNTLLSIVSAGYTELVKIFLNASNVFLIARGHFCTMEACYDMAFKLIIHKKRISLAKVFLSSAKLDQSAYNRFIKLSIRMKRREMTELIATNKRFDLLECMLSADRYIDNSVILWLRSYMIRKFFLIRNMNLVSDLLSIILIWSILKNN